MRRRRIVGCQCETDLLSVWRHCVAPQRSSRFLYRRLCKRRGRLFIIYSQNDCSACHTSRERSVCCHCARRRSGGHADILYLVNAHAGVDIAESLSFIISVH